MMNTKAPMMAVIGIRNGLTMYISSTGTSNGLARPD
jgi:hypothetical protein